MSLRPRIPDHQDSCSGMRLWLDRMVGQEVAVTLAGLRNSSYYLGFDFDLLNYSQVVKHLS